MYFFSFLDGDYNAIGIQNHDGLFNFSLALDIYQQSQGNAQPIPVTFLQVLVEMGFCSLEAANEVMNNPWVQAKLSDLRASSHAAIEVPIARPSKIIGIGRNYAAHAKELNHDIPETPVFFAKAPSSMLATGRDIVIPGWVEGRVDHEAELAVVIGKEAHNVPAHQAMEYVAGYTLLNDVTARDMQKNDMAASQPWFRSKGLDTFCPLGPGITPADAIEDVQKLNMALTVNGEVRQQCSTADMLFPIPRLIEEVSRFMTLNPGDIIATGTPEGVGPIEDGDEIVITIAELGQLKNRVRRG